MGVMGEVGEGNQGVMVRATGVAEPVAAETAETAKAEVASHRW